MRRRTPAKPPVTTGCIIGPQHCLDEDFDATDPLAEAELVQAIVAGKIGTTHRSHDYQPLTILHTLGQQLYTPPVQHPDIETVIATYRAAAEAQCQALAASFYANQAETEPAAEIPAHMGPIDAH